MKLFLLFEVKDVIVTVDDLVHRLTVERRMCRAAFNESLSINVFSSSGQSTTGLNGQFVYSQLLIDCLLRLQSNKNDKNELIQLCRDKCKTSSIESKHLDEFESRYKSDEVLRWYTRETFFYKLLNSALRTQDIHFMYLFRSFIFDIQEQLKNNQFKQIIQVYRGQVMSDEELDQLKQSQGQFISINAFFSTSRSEKHARFLLGSQTSSTIRNNRILFEIHADPQLVKSKPFADITRFSDFPDEQEVLFMIGSIFHIKSVVLDNEQMWNIQLDLCSDHEHKLKDVLSYMKEKMGIGPTNLRILGDILWKMGKLDLAEKYLTRLCQELPSDDRLLGVLYDDLGSLTSQKGDLDQSLAWHEKSRALQKQNSNESTSDYFGVRRGSIYGNLSGGSPFNDSTDLKLPAMTCCIGVEVFWHQFLSCVRFIYDRNDELYPKIYHGNADDKPDHTECFLSDRFMLSNEEKFNGVTLYIGQGAHVGGYLTFAGQSITIVTGIQFHTTEGRTTRLYGAKDEGEYTESFEGYVLGYVRGRCGLAIDEFQFIWHKQMDNLSMWIESQYGQIPSDAVEGGKENDRSVYIVRFKTKENQMIPGKLIEGSKIAVAPYFGVRTSSTYQILINRTPKRDISWVTFDANKLPSNALQIENYQGTTYYIGRFVHPSSGSIIIGTFNTNLRTFFYVHDEQEKEFTGQFEILCVL